MAPLPATGPQSSSFTQAIELLSGPPLFDGCRLRYLDLGTNSGGRVESMYADLSQPPGRWEKLFTGWNRSEVCTVGFEPNPRHTSRLQYLQAELRRRGHRVTILSAAVSDRNGSAHFYSDQDAAHQEWASSLWQWNNRMGPRHSSRVPMFQLDWFLRYHLGQAWPAGDAPPPEQPAAAPRLAAPRNPQPARLQPVPSSCRGCSRAAPAGGTLTLVKFDAEIAEYAALPPSIWSGSLCRSVDLLQLEQHAHLLKKMVQQGRLLNGRPPEEEAKGLKRTLQDAVQYARRMHVSGKCRTVIEDMSIWGT
jgi:hypothetical protein